ncbi:hypothetical protein PR202_gb11867 [Eleusine coracana subsp. coracana]|uniref:Uncharacterized protein n=1 Tax=Eleusine coracana subsp. coracana TaxID=191504 RepID=A0AAV5EPH4_ELECO|nr:hypothetical protein PR202_gb11867 [Eleusine coracana subsp. coracana]
MFSFIRYISKGKIHQNNYILRCVYFFEEYVFFFRIFFCRVFFILQHSENFFLFFEVVGIIKRKALIKELAAAYHAECMTNCKELLQLQRMWEKVCIIHFL